MTEKIQSIITYFVSNAMIHSMPWFTPKREHFFQMFFLLSPFYDHGISEILSVDYLFLSAPYWQIYDCQNKIYCKYYIHVSCCYLVVVVVCFWEIIFYLLISSTTILDNTVIENYGMEKKYLLQILYIVCKFHMLGQFFLGLESSLILTKRAIILLISSDGSIHKSFFKRVKMIGFSERLTWFQADFLCVCVMRYT